MAFYVYIVASRRNGTLYVGQTDALAKRIWQHKTKSLAGFTARYGVSMLVWYEVHSNRESAVIRERQLKEWKRAWKLRLIEQANPDWNDLYETLNS
jgi:putative endonuclease